MSLGDLQRDQRTGRPQRPVDRMGEILGYAELADQLGLDVFALGRFRPPLKEAAVVPRAIQEKLPVWVGVGGSSDSAERAGRLGLPMVLGYIGGTLGRLRPLLPRVPAS